MKFRVFLGTLFCLIILSNLQAFSQNYKIVDTGQSVCYDSVASISTPVEGADYYGQDANYSGNQPSYTDNGDGTILDNVTGLMWFKSPDLNGDGLINVSDKLSYENALAAADTLSFAGYNDWRLPSIKEQYSLMYFAGIDPSGFEGSSTDALVPFVNTDYFDFNYGDQDAGERIIDAQMATTTLYVGTTMMGDATMFGVNFADGRIKGYGTGPMPNQTEDKLFYVYFVRGNQAYGENDFHDNDDGTITDNATGLMWMQDDNGEGVIWKDALEYAENSESSGYNDWRLPNVKELQSILDYSRSPSTTNSAAIDSLFNCSQIVDEGGNNNYPFYWSSTTHANWTASLEGSAAAYVCFGEALGWMESYPNSGEYTLMDVHGAGAQRSDPKCGDPADYPYGNGPQGDVIRIFNYVRLVRDIPLGIGDNVDESNSKVTVFPNPSNDFVNIKIDGLNKVNTCSVEIVNQLGQTEISYPIESDNIILDVKGLSSGVYFVKVLYDNNEIVKQLIIN